MENSAYVADFTATASSTVVTTSHFGGNIVANANTVRDDTPFSDVVDYLGLTSLRYPGGTVTEQYFDPLGWIWEVLFGDDPQDYVVADDGSTIMGPTSFFSYAADAGVAVDYVLPTLGLLSYDSFGSPVVNEDALAEVRSAVEKILKGEYGEVDIRSFEIGNEYNIYPEMTAEEYGVVANALIKVVGEEIANFEKSSHASPEWTAPLVAVQGGVGWQSGDAETIIESLDDSARGLVDQVVLHFYPPDLNGVDNFGNHFGQFDIWQESDGFGDLDLMVSEWNIHNTTDKDSGLLQASSIISAFSEMLSVGVDYASIWGIQFRWLDTGLSEISGHDDLDTDPADIESWLTVSGEIVASLFESVEGLNSFDPDLSILLRDDSAASTDPDSPNAELMVEAFGNADRVVLYISSRSSDTTFVQLDLEAYFLDYGHVWGEILSAVDNPVTSGDESDPLVSGAAPVYETLGSSEDFEGTSIELAPYEILRVTVQLSDDGVVMEGHDPSVVVADVSYDDDLVGSDGDDEIIGHIGDDHLFAGAGADLVLGGEGDDFIDGFDGADVIRTGDGFDYVLGGDGNDVIVNSGGADTAYAGAGNDVLISTGQGSLVAGGDGNDLLRVSESGNSLQGGEGSDYFIIECAEGTEVLDFSADDGDKITFLGQFESQEAFIDNASLVETDEGTHIEISTGLGGTAAIYGTALSPEELAEYVVDFSEIGIDTLETADVLNHGTTDEIADFAQYWSSQGIDSLFENIDPILLIANIDADAAAQLFNELSDSELNSFLDHLGDTGVALLMEQFDEAEVEDFLDIINQSSLISIVDIYGLSEVHTIASAAGDAAESLFIEGMRDTEYTEVANEYDWLQASLYETSQQEEDVQLIEDLQIQPVTQQSDASEEQQSDANVEAVQLDCFVASVAYADPDHDKVWLLRWYRDAVLRKSVFGRFLIRWYWQIGPHLAVFGHDHPAFSMTTRGLLNGIVWAICKLYGREPARQTDHPVCTDSRLIYLNSIKSGSWLKR